MEKHFEDLGIAEPILRALAEMGFEMPTEVQSQAIPLILEQKDLLVKSKTGSGKTAVFGIPLLQLIDPQAAGPQGLILTPTRELAVQIDNNLKQMGKYLKHKTTAVYGQHNPNTEIQALNRGVSIVTGTPGRVFDHISNRNLMTKNIRYLVLDEADRMLDMGFFDQVIKIIKTLPRDRVTLLFSATIPAEVQRISRNFMKRTQTIEIESPTMTVDTTEQIYYRVAHNEKNYHLNRLLLVEHPESCIIFCNTRIAVDRVQNFLSRKGYASQALHGDIPQGKRLKTIQQFKRGDFPLLVATDVAARGIHIDSLSLVINYDVPVEKDSYVHRIGRTGRAGEVGKALTMVTSDDIISLYEIEEHIGTLIPEAELPDDADLSKHKADAELWMQKMRNMKHPSQMGQAKKSRTTQVNQAKQTKQSKLGPKNRQYQASDKRGQSAPGSVKTYPKREQSPARPRQDLPKTEQAPLKKEQTITKNETATIVRGQTPQVKTFTPTAKENLLQRIFNRLFK